MIVSIEQRIASNQLSVGYFCKTQERKVEMKVEMKVERGRTRRRSRPGD